MYQLLYYSNLTNVPLFAYFRLIRTGLTARIGFLSSEEMTMIGIVIWTNGSAGVSELHPYIVVGYADIISLLMLVAISSKCQCCICTLYTSERACQCISLIEMRTPLRCAAFFFILHHFITNACGQLFCYCTLSILSLYSVQFGMMDAHYVSCTLCSMCACWNRVSSVLSVSRRLAIMRHAASCLLHCCTMSLY